MASHQYVAFLRAINVGKRPAKSDELVRAFESTGFSAVETFLASGNVIFQSAKKKLEALQREIEEALLSELDFRSEAFVRTMAEVVEIARANPFNLSEVDCESFTTNVVLLNESPTYAMQQALQGLRTDYDDFAVGRQEVFWLCRGKKISDSTLFAKNSVQKAIKALSTIRNLRTFERIVAKHG